MALINQLITGSSSLYPGVMPKLNNRSNINPIDCERWLVSAIRNITSTYPFEELCIDCPAVTLQQGVATYTVGYLTSTTGIYFSRFDSFMLQVSGTTWIPLKWRTKNFVKPLSMIQGQPLYFTTYGATVANPAAVPPVVGVQNVMVAFSPTQNYQAMVSAQRKFVPVDGSTDVVPVPDDWLDVIVAAAALIGAEENRMADKQTSLRVELFGDPKNDGEPGLIKRLISARAQASNINERQFNFMAGVH